MISAGPPTGHPRAKKLEPPLAGAVISVAVETVEPINNAGLEFLSDLGTRISQMSNDHRESAILFHSSSVYRSS